MGNEKLKTKSTVCTNCGGQLNIDISKDTVECPYCGTSYQVNELINESDAVRIEKIKTNAQQEIEKEKLKHEVEKNKTQQEEDEITKFKKSKFSKVLLIFFVISVLFFFAGQGFLVKTLTFVQAVLFIGAWLMGAKVIKEPKKRIHTILAIIAFVLIIPILSINGKSSSSKTEHTIVWNDIVMNEMLPKPKKNKGYIYSNSEEHLSIDVYKSSKEDYNKYVEECKEKGFTVESKKDTNSYDAYNENGYKLRIDYREYNKEYNISLDAPMQMKENAWVSTPLSKLLPEPTSKVGKVDSNSEKYFTYYAGKTSKDDFSTYANSVLNAGFTNEYKSGDEYFYGKNSDGYKVDIQYKGNNVMRISIEAPKETEKVENTKPTEENKTETTPPTTTPTETTPTQPTETTKPSNNSTGVSKEFKETMDSYEKFFDEYIAFMKKYEKSNGTDVSLIADYAKYMQQYAETMKKFEDMKDDDMNAEETAYYIQVQSRINQKLLEVAQ